jgi:hypothetical protein
MYRGLTLSHGVRTHCWYIGVYRFLGHMVTLDPSMWWSRVLFPT